MYQVNETEISNGLSFAPYYNEPAQIMHSIKVNRESLLAKVRTNRDLHATQYKESVDGYREEVIKQYEDILAEIKAGGKIRRGVTLPEPINHTDDYDRVIAMLEMSVDVDLELDGHLFDQYVRDNWSWKQQHLSSNAFYSKTGH